MTVGFNFLEAPELPAPRVSDQQAEEILRLHYGIRAQATSLGSNQDKNFIVSDAAGETVGVLKIANPAFTAAELEAQDLAAELIAAAEPTLRVSLPIPNAAGEKCTTAEGLIDRTAYIRLLRFLPGGTLLESAYLSPSAVAGLGEVAGRVSRALAAFSHPGLDRVLQWDLRYGVDVVRQLISHVDDSSLADRLEVAASDAWSRIEPLADALPRQAVHLDLTDANVVVSRSNSGAAHPDGVIDFGDLTNSWAVSELAITVSSVLGHAGADPASVLPAVRAFHAIRPLGDAEVDVLWPLLVLRTAVLMVSCAQQLVLDPDNDYLTDQSGGEERMFTTATSVPMDVMTAVIRADLGLAVAPEQVAVERVMVESAAVVTLDLSTASDALRFRQLAGTRRRGRVGPRRRARRRNPGGDAVWPAEAEPGPETQPGQPGRHPDRYQLVVGV